MSFDLKIIFSDLFAISRQFDANEDLESLYLLFPYARVPLAPGEHGVGKAGEPISAHFPYISVDEKRVDLNWGGPKDQITVRGDPPQSIIWLEETHLSIETTKAKGGGSKHLKLDHQYKKYTARLPEINPQDPQYQTFNPQCFANNPNPSRPRIMDARVLIDDGKFLIDELAKDENNNHELKWQFKRTSGKGNAVGPKDKKLAIRWRLTIDGLETAKLLLRPFSSYKSTTALTLSPKLKKGNIEIQIASSPIWDIFDFDDRKRAEKKIERNRAKHFEFFYKLTQKAPAQPYIPWVYQGGGLTSGTIQCPQGGG